MRVLTLEAAHFSFQAENQRFTRILQQMKQYKRILLLGRMSHYLHHQHIQALEEGRLGHAVIPRKAEGEKGKLQQQLDEFQAVYASAPEQTAT